MLLFILETKFILHEKMISIIYIMQIIQDVINIFPFSISSFKTAIT